MKCITFIRAAGRFPHIRALISRDIANSTRDSPIRTSDLYHYFDGGLIHLDSRGQTDPAVILTSQTKAPSTICSNCKLPAIPSPIASPLEEEWLGRHSMSPNLRENVTKKLEIQN